MHDLGHHLCWSDRVEDFFTEGARTDAIDELLCDLHAHVRGQQGEPDFAQRGIHVVLGEVTLAPERLHDARQSVLQRIQHGRRSLGHTSLPVKGLARDRCPETMRGEWLLPTIGTTAIAAVLEPTPPSLMHYIPAAV